MIFSGGEGTKNNAQHHWVIWASLVISSIMDSINWPNPWGMAVPDLTPLVLLYWIMAINSTNFIITTMIFGIMHDVLYHTGLGTYALIYLLLVFPMLHIKLQLRNTTLLHMSLFIGLWMLAHQFLVWLLTAANHITLSTISFWVAALIGTLLWPLIFISLRTLRRQMRVR
jgi:rod shape-determining protein MreD